MGLHEQGEAAPRDTMRIFYRAANKHRTDLLLSLLQPVGAVLIGVAVPFYTGKVLASLAQAPAQSRHYLISLGVISFVAVAINRVGAKANMRMQAKTMADLNAMVFDRLLARSVGYHANRISGKLVSDAIDFVSSFSMLMQSGFNNGVTFVLIMLVGLALVFVNTWQLGLYLLAVVTIICVWTYHNSRKRSKIRARRLVATKALTAHLSDTIVNAPTVKTFAQEDYEKNRNLELNHRLKGLRLNDWQAAVTSGNSRMTALLALQVCLMWLITVLVARHPLMLATGIFALSYTLTISIRLFDLNLMTIQIEDAFLNAGPMSRMLMEDTEIKDRPDARVLEVTKGEIRIANATFAYRDSEQHTGVFKELTLTVAPGEKIGLIGPSGGGKSTLTRLLLRFDDLQNGEITVDGQDIAAVTQTSLRKSIAYVPQEPLLFHRTIRENIAYGKPDATDEEITAATRQAQADHFIRGLPKGYDTTVGERGVKLSGGQRQRVAIARAILKNAPILILDEATSALDSESEVAIQKALWELMRGRTAIVVAHRLSTIQRMDRIIVLDDGQIVEVGTHKKLLAKKGLYAQLWNHQSGGFIED
jgi:ATP-binding cassette, subfamily B, bacterial